MALTLRSRNLNHPENEPLKGMAYSGHALRPTLTTQAFMLGFQGAEEPLHSFSPLRLSDGLRPHCLCYVVPHPRSGVVRF